MEATRKDNKPRVSILGCGWLGLALAQELVKNYLVKGSVRELQKSKELLQFGIQPFSLSLENINSATQDFFQTDILIIATPPQSLDSYQAVIASLIENQVKKVIFISSTSVYKAEGKAVKENSPKVDKPLVEAEKLFTENSNFKATVIRFCGLYGYNRQPSNFFKEGRVIPNPENSVNMIHRDDCISIITKIIENKHWGHTLNACSDFHPIRREFYASQSLNNNKLSPIFAEVSTSPDKIVNSEQLKELLNYQFKHSI